MANEFWHGQRAAEALVKAVYGVDVRKALDPLHPHDFLVIQKRLADSLKGLSAAAHKDAITHALNTLDVDWSRMSEAQKDRVFKEANVALAAAQRMLIPSVVRQLDLFGKQMVTATKGAAAKKFSLDLQSAFTVKDQKVMQHAASSQALFVRNAQGQRLTGWSQKVRDVVSSGLDRGLGRKDIAAEVKDAVGSYVKRDDSYWNVIANVFANRARVYASLSAYEESEIDNYRFEAVLDEVTTMQCRFLDGRIFPVKVALQKYADVAAGDPEDVKYVQPWLSSGKDDDGNEVLFYKDKAGGKVVVADVLENAEGLKDQKGKFKPRLSDAQLAGQGVCVPPLHANCRSSIVPDF